MGGATLELKSFASEVPKECSDSFLFQNTWHEDLDFDMSWLRSAVNKAVEAGGNNNLTRTVRSYADSVVYQAGQAVVGGAKLLQDRIGARNFQSFKHAVKRLEEVSVSCRGVERIQMLRRWLVALKEIERFYGSAVDQGGTERNSGRFHMSNQPKDFPKRPIMVLYYDDLSTEPMNFRDVFLHSRALEGVTLSMILEAPEEEEISLLLEIFGICLTGGREVHAAILRSIQNLAKVFLSYEEEFLAKREELLQCAQDAIARLKVNAEMLRIDSEVANIQQRLDEMTSRLALTEGDEKVSGGGSSSSTEGLKVAFQEIQLCSRLEALLLRKNILNSGDSSENHAQKVDKLRVLSESLINSASKAEKRISDNRIQRDEALKFRKTKTSETSELEKEMAVEIEALEREKDELEEKLKKVNASLTSIRARLHNAREEREQFDEASNQIVQHFKVKEDELSRSIASYRAEADACNAFIAFLEKTWAFQTAFIADKKKRINDELEGYGDYFVNLAIQLLSSYKGELDQSIQSYEKLVENLKGLETVPCNEKMDAFNTRKTLERKYLSAEYKLTAMFSIVESLRRQFYAQDEVFRKNDQRVNELLDALEKMKGEFDSIPRPTLEVETCTTKAETPSEEASARKGTLRGDSTVQDRRSRSLSMLPDQSIEMWQYKMDEYTEFADLPSITNGKKVLDPTMQLSKLNLELELENYSRENSPEELEDWEFDHVEKN